MVVGLATDSRHQEWSPVSLGKGVAGQRRANAATNRESTAYRPYIERILGAYWVLIGDYHNDCAARIRARCRPRSVWQTPVSRQRLA